MKHRFGCSLVRAQVATMIGTCCPASNVVQLFRIDLVYGLILISVCNNRHTNLLKCSKILVVTDALPCSFLDRVHASNGVGLPSERHS